MLAWLTFLFTKTIKIRSRKSGSVSNSAEIFAVLRTAYRVFFENSQIFGAACRNERKFLPAGLGASWNLRKFFPAVLEHAGTGGNSFPQFGNIPEPAEICSRSLATCWNWRKFVPAGLEYAGTSGNLSARFGNALEPVEICPRSLGTRRNRRKLSQYYALLTDFSSKTRKGFLEKHKNSQSLFASQTIAACLWQEITHKKEVGKRYIRVFFTGCRFSRVAVKSAISCLLHDH